MVSCCSHHMGTDMVSCWSQNLGNNTSSLSEKIKNRFLKIALVEFAKSMLKVLAFVIYLIVFWLSSVY